MVEHQSHNLTQSRSKDRVAQISFSLVYIMYGVVLSHAASPKACQLRKNKPHSMCLFATSGKFLDDLLVNLILSVQEANEVNIGHWCCTSGLNDQGR
jgi:hypothetical protein